MPATSQRDILSALNAGARLNAVAIAPGIKTAGVSMRFDRNEEIFGQGEPANHLYRVVRGAARTIRFSSDGRRQILAFHLPGDVFGFDLGLIHGFSAEAVCDCELMLVRRLAIERASEHVDAARALLALANAEMNAAREHALILGYKGAVERIAAFLLDIARRTEADSELELPMSRADIADYLALTIETVSRAFTQMERDGAIDMPASRRIVLRDRAAIAQLSAA